MPFRFARAFALAAFFFFLLPPGVGALGKRWLVLCVALVCGIRLLMYSPPTDGSDYFPGQGKDLLTCGYRQEGNELVLDILGAQDERIFLEFSTRKIASLGLDTRSIVSSLQAQNAVAPSGMLEGYLARTERNA
jgi:hypothetical protein